MSADRRPPSTGQLRAARACPACMRRSWLLATLSAVIERRARDRERLAPLLALDDSELIAAIGGRRREELAAALAAFDAASVRHGPDVSSLCRHDPRFPRSLVADGWPRSLFVLGDCDRLARLAAGPAVAVLGDGVASDYGRALARTIARGLAVSGVTVLCVLAAGVGAAATDGALDGGGGVTIVCGGIDVAHPARLRGRLRGLAAAGAVISELPCGCESRRWAVISAQRIAVRLASVVVLVEAGESSPALLAAREGRASGRAVAALPGRVSSPLAAGPIELLREGAVPVRGAGEVLELLAERPPARPDAREVHAQATLQPRLRAVLHDVAGGRDTIEALVGGAADPGAILESLAELELLGLLRRGDGGRYVPCGEAIAGSDGRRW